MTHAQNDDDSAAKGSIKASVLYGSSKSDFIHTHFGRFSENRICGFSDSITKSMSLIPGTHVSLMACFEIDHE